MRARPPKPKREPTITLINIVFLMLVFFMVAGTLSPPLDKTITLVNTRDLDGSQPPDALVVHSDGRLTLRGEVVSDVASHVGGMTEAERSSIRVIPDRAVDAQVLIALGRDLRSAGAGRVLIVTERGLE